MKVKTYLRAGGSGCSPETLNYMQKTVNMQHKVENCYKQGNVTQQPVYGGYYPNYGGSGYPLPLPSTPPSYVGSNTTYPDRSGICG